MNIVGRACLWLAIVVGIGTLHTEIPDIFVFLVFTVGGIIFMLWGGK